MEAGKIGPDQGHSNRGGKGAYCSDGENDDSRCHCHGGQRSFYDLVQGAAGLVITFAQPVRNLFGNMILGRESGNHLRLIYEFAGKLL